MFINMRLKYKNRVLKLCRPLPIEAIDSITIVSDIYRDLTSAASSMAEVTEGPVTLEETTDTELGTDVMNNEDVAQGAIDLAG